MALDVTAILLERPAVNRTLAGSLEERHNIYYKYMKYINLRVSLNSRQCNHGRMRRERSPADGEELGLDGEGDQAAQRLGVFGSDQVGDPTVQMEPKLLC